jgi:ubiquitin-protein ligase
MREDPRTRRLRADYERLYEIKGRSDLIDFETVDVKSGSPPEKYIITYRCRGITGIDDQKQPVFGNFHQVSIYLDMEYPMIPPKLLWLTPIWHPNIRHTQPRLVCIDPTWWAAGRMLDTVTLMLGEMVQYKNYHAEHTPPFPLDNTVADWVIWAERQGIVSHSKPVDERELLREERIKIKSSQQDNPTVVPAPGTQTSTPGPVVHLEPTNTPQKPVIKIIS